MIDVVATSDFVHGKLDMSKGCEASLSEQMAKDLCEAGLVVFSIAAGSNKAAEPVVNKMAPPARNRSTKPRKDQSAASVSGIDVGASADVCTNNPGALVKGTPNDSTAPQAPDDATGLGDEEASGRVAPPMPADDGAPS